MVQIKVTILALAITALLAPLASANHPEIEIIPWLTSNCAGTPNSDDFSIKESKCQNIQLQSFKLAKHGRNDKWIDSVEHSKIKCGVNFYYAPECLDSVMHGDTDLFLPIPGNSFFDGECIQFDPLGAWTGSALFHCEEVPSVNSTHVVEKSHASEKKPAEKKHAKVPASAFAA